MSGFDDYFAKFDTDAWAAQFAAEPVAGRPAVKPAGEPLSAHKLSSVVCVPNELLMDAGVIPDTRPPLPPPTWRTRVRYRIGAWRERAAERAYKIIAGYEVPKVDW